MRVHLNYDAINVPKLEPVRISLRKNLTPSTKLAHTFVGSIQTIFPVQEDNIFSSQKFQPYSYDPNMFNSIIKVPNNIDDQQNNLNPSLLNSNMKMVRLNNATHDTILKVRSILLLIVAKGMLLINNIIQAYKRIATRLFTKLQTFVNPNNDFQMKVLKSKKEMSNNGWSPELEMEMRGILEVVKRKNIMFHKRRQNLALKITKTLAILGPLFTGIAAIGLALEKNGSSWAGVMAAFAKLLAGLVKPLEEMVVEICKNCSDYLQDTIEATLVEKDFEKRENGEIFEIKVARKLGRSVSQLRQLALKFGAYDSGEIHMDA